MNIMVILIVIFVTVSGHRELLADNYPIYVLINSATGQQITHSIELPSDKTLRDVVQCVSSIDSALNEVHKDDIIVTVSGQKYKASIPGNLDTLLSDAGVGAESVIEVSIVALQDISDIQLLFRIFTNSRHSEEALGYQSYSDFVSNHTDLCSQKYWLQRESTMTITFWEDGVSVMELIWWCLHGDVGWSSSINWDVIGQINQLKTLTIANARITGVLPFDKLPRTLYVLGLTGNYLSGISFPEQCPPGLRVLVLDNNEFDRKIVSQQFPVRFLHFSSRLSSE